MEKHVRVSLGSYVIVFLPRKVKRKGIPGGVLQPKERNSGAGKNVKYDFAVSFQEAKRQVAENSGELIIG